jgi:O-antigen/teichoic acid export membrane protein
MKDLKSKTIRGGLARMLAQGANFVLRLVTLMILARLLEPNDFGLVGMVTAFTGVLSLFRDFGLSSAAIQRDKVSEEQVSTLFWINLLVGVVLAFLAVAMAPAIAALYHEPRLIPVAAVLAAGFVFNAAGVQHGALLQREMRFTALAVINTVSLIAAGTIAVITAKMGFGYWALVAMTVVLPLTTTIGSWIVSGWIPGKAYRRAGIRSMMRFGGMLTANSLVVYVANNFDKVLLGRYWGVDALGIYGRAYQLVNIPIDNLNSAAGEVAFSALSRIQNDGMRLKNYFLKGYSLILAMTIPITVTCALFAHDLISVLLGPKWHAAIPIFRLLAPTILAFAIVNPFGWFIYSLGMAGRALKMALVIAPIMIAGFMAGLPYGAMGVAAAYSVVMLLWIVPAIAWAVHGTVLSIREVFVTASRPLAAGLLAGLVAFFAGLACRELPSIARLMIEVSVLLAAYAGLLLFATGQRSLYLDILRGLRTSEKAGEATLVST